MEDSPAQGPGKAVFRPEAKGQNQSPNGFHAEAAHQHRPFQPHHAVDVVQAQGLGHNQPLLQADPLAQGKDEQRRRRHKPQTADLNQHKDHHLPEAAPLAPGVKQRKARDAGSGSSREQRGKEAAGNAAAGRRRQRQQPGSQRNDHRENDGDDFGGAEGFGTLVHPKRIQLCSQRHMVLLSSGYTAP